MELLKFKFIKLSAYTPILFLVAIGLSLVVFRLYPARIADNMILISIIGSLFFIAGTTIVILAERTHHSLFHLTQGLTCNDFAHGIYKYSRHPGTLGFLLLFFGFGFLINSQAVVAMAVLHFFLLSIVFIPLLEQEVAKHCGEPYHEYQQKVRMWL
jgi:protein-S-isoprenylcysteine O-methyltransferase Ste14